MTGVPTRHDVPLPIRGCICKRCGKIADSWFPPKWLMGHDGFECDECADAWFSLPAAERERILREKGLLP